MAVTASKADGDTTFTFEITGLSTKVDPMIEQWAKYAWEHGYHATEEVGGETVKVEWDDATNQQKLNAINRRIKALGLSEANTQEIDDDVRTARDDATQHDLEEVD